MVFCRTLAFQKVKGFHKKIPLQYESAVVIVAVIIISIILLSFHFGSSSN
jgi:hypothetical protein